MLKRITFEVETLKKKILNNRLNERIKRQAATAEVGGIAGHAAVTSSSSSSSAVIASSSSYNEDKPGKKLSPIIHDASNGTTKMSRHHLFTDGKANKLNFK